MSASQSGPVGAASAGDAASDATPLMQQHSPTYDAAAGLPEGSPPTESAAWFWELAAEPAHSRTRPRGRGDSYDSSDSDVDTPGGVSAASSSTARPGAGASADGTDDMDDLERPLLLDANGEGLDVDLNRAMEGGASSSGSDSDAPPDDKAMMRAAGGMTGGDRKAAPLDPAADSDADADDADADAGEGKGNKGNKAKAKGNKGKGKGKGNKVGFAEDSANGANGGRASRILPGLDHSYAGLVPGARRHSDRPQPPGGIAATTSLAMTCSVQAVFMLLVGVSAGAESIVALFVDVIATALQLFQLVLLSAASYHVVRHLRHVELSEAWCYYTITALSFGGFYSCVLLYVDEATALNIDWRIVGTTDEARAYMYYFSVATQTCVGFGDISPGLGAFKVMVAVQIVLGMFYHVFIISSTIGRLNKRKPDSRAVKAAKRLTCRRRCSRNPLLRRARRWARGYLLAITITIEAGNFLLLYSAESSVFSVDSVRYDLMLPSVVIQISAVVSVLATSLKIARKTYKVTLGFILQSYLSVVLCFAGVYVALYLFDPADRAFSVMCPDYSQGGGSGSGSGSGSGASAAAEAPLRVADAAAASAAAAVHAAAAPGTDSVGGTGEGAGSGGGIGLQPAALLGGHHTVILNACRATDSQNEEGFWTTVYSFVYFSLTTMTTTGYGGIVPRTWYTRLAVSCQMLVCVFFSVVIMGLGLKRLARYDPDALLRRLAAEHGSVTDGVLGTGRGRATSAAFKRHLIRESSSASGLGGGGPFAREPSFGPTSGRDGPGVSREHSLHSLHRYHSTEDLRVGPGTHGSEEWRRPEPQDGRRGNGHSNGYADGYGYGSARATAGGGGGDVDDDAIRRSQSAAPRPYLHGPLLVAPMEPSGASQHRHGDDDGTGARAVAHSLPATTGHMAAAAAAAAAGGGGGAADGVGAAGAAAMGTSMPASAGGLHARTHSAPEPPLVDSSSSSNSSRGGGAGARLA